MFLNKKLRFADLERLNWKSIFLLFHMQDFIGLLKVIEMLYNIYFCFRFGLANAIRLLKLKNVCREFLTFNAY